MVMCYLFFRHYLSLANGEAFFVRKSNKPVLRIELFQVFSEATSPGKLSQPHRETEIWSTRKFL